MCLTEKTCVLDNLHLDMKNSVITDFPGGASGKEPTYQGRRHKRPESHPWAGRLPGVGNGNPLQHFCLENSMDRGAWWGTNGPWGRKESDMTEATQLASHFQTTENQT